MYVLFNYAVYCVRYSRSFRGRVGGIEEKHTVLTSFCNSVGGLRSVNISNKIVPSFYELPKTYCINCFNFI